MTTKTTATFNTDKKPNRTTFKTFLKHGYGKLFIKNLSCFDGMVDCVMPITHIGDNQGWHKLTPKDDQKDLPINEIMKSHDYNLGFDGIWLTKQRDFFSWYKSNDYVGIEVSNCCGNFIIGWRVA